MKSRIILPIAFCLITANLSLKAQSYTDYIDSSFIYIEAGNLTKAEKCATESPAYRAGQSGKRSFTL